MKRILFTIILLINIEIHAQQHTEPTLIQAYTPPVAERISVTQFENYVVRVIGEANSVAPSIHIAIRNLYTRDTTIVESNSDGSFSVRLDGLDNMPYLVAYTENLGIPEVHPLDGIGTIIYPNTIEEQDISIGLGGWVSYGWMRWFADASINQAHLRQGDNLSVSMEVSFIDALNLVPIPDYDYRMRGQLGLYPLADELGNSLSNEIRLDEDGSFEFLSNDLPHLENREIEITAIETTVIENINDNMVFDLDFQTPLSDNIISGEYMLVFTGEIKVDDSDFALWYESRHFAIDGTNGITLMATARPHPIILPLLITIEHNANN